MSERERGRVGGSMPAGRREGSREKAILTLAVS